MSDEQRSPAWYAARLGLVTASRIADVMSSGTGRETYMTQLLCERMTGQPMESFINEAMQHGIDTEAEARRAYETKTGEFVNEVGFIRHPRLAAGASPDGLVGDEGEGAIEIKCPKTNSHINTLLDEKVPTKYANYQIQWQMACTGRKWVDFVSYDNRMPERLRLFVKRVERDEKRIAELEAGVEKFLAELDDKVAKLKEMQP